MFFEWNAELAFESSAYVNWKNLMKVKLQKLCEEKQMLGQWDNMVKKHKKSKSKKPKYA